MRIISVPIISDADCSGYTGHEFQVRAELKRRLGEEHYEYFFDKVSDRMFRH